MQSVGLCDRFPTGGALPLLEGTDIIFPCLVFQIELGPQSQ